METKNKRPIRVMLMALQMTAWGLHELLKSAGPQFELVASVDTLDDACKAARDAKPHALVIDADAVADRDQVLASGLEDSTRIIVLTGVDDALSWESAAHCAVRGLVRKTDPPESLLSAIQAVSDGELWMPPGAMGRSHAEAGAMQVAEGAGPASARVQTLTAREREVLAVLASDTTTPAHVLAHRLSVSVNTLRHHLKQIYSKLGVNSRVDLYAFAVRHQLPAREFCERTRESADKRGPPAHAASQQNGLR